jgi:uncharacterized protein YbaR (Trm112 family)
MISQDLLDMLRCPLDPSHVRLEASGDSLVCTRCRLRFPVRHDIPCMLVEEAELPPGVASLDDLPCQREKAGSATAPEKQS